MITTRPTGRFARLVRRLRDPLQVAVGHHGGIISAWGWESTGVASATGVLSHQTPGRELLALAVTDAVATLPRYRRLEILTADRVLVAQHRDDDRRSGVVFRVDHAAALDIVHGLDRHPDVVARMQNYQALRRVGVDTAGTVNAKTVVVACDGSYSAPGRVGAWAWRTAGGRHAEGAATATTSVLCELEAFVRALEELDASHLRFVSDCETIVCDVRQLLRTGCVPARLSCTTNGAGDLWERARRACAGRTVSIEWVKGHSGHNLHGQVDRAARRIVRAAVRAASDTADAAHVADPAGSELIAV